MGKNQLAIEKKVEKGSVISVTGKNAVIQLEESESNIILNNVKNLRDNDTVYISKKNKLSLRVKKLLYALPVIFFIIGFGVGFIFKSDLAHYGLALGMYGLSMMLMIIVKNNIEFGFPVKYTIEKIERSEPEIVASETEKLPESVESETLEDSTQEVDEAVADNKNDVTAEVTTEEPVESNTNNEGENNE